MNDYNPIIRVMIQALTGHTMHSSNISLIIRRRFLIKLPRHHVSYNFLCRSYLQSTKRCGGRIKTRSFVFTVTTVYQYLVATVYTRDLFHRKNRGDRSNVVIVSIELRVQFGYVPVACNSWMHVRESRVLHTRSLSIIFSICSR